METNPPLTKREYFTLKIFCALLAADQKSLHFNQYIIEETPKLAEKLLKILEPQEKAD